MVQLFERNLGKRRSLFLERKKGSRKGPLWKGCMSCGAVSSARRRIQNPLASGTLRSSTLWSRPASGLGEAGSVYTCHEGGGGRKGEPQQSPKLLCSSRRERPARSCGQVGAEGQGEPAAAGEVTTTTLTSPPVPGVARRKPYASGAAAGFPAPAAEEGRAQARSPQARRAGTSPQPRAPRQTGALCPGEDPAGGLGPLTLSPQA